MTYTYERSWVEIEDMLDRAERLQNQHYMAIHNTNDKKKKLVHMRNYKALEGVVKSLRWVLGDRRITTPLE